MKKAKTIVDYLKEKVLEVEETFKTKMKKIDYDKEYKKILNKE